MGEAKKVEPGRRENPKHHTKPGNTLGCKAKYNKECLPQPLHLQNGVFRSDTIKQIVN